MSWFDIVLVAGVAALTALGAKRKMTGLIVGLGSLVLFRVLITFTERGLWGIIVALIMAILAGVLFGMLGRAAVLKNRGLELPLSIAGGLGGLLAGIVLVGALVTSLPIEKRFDGAIVYPPQQLPSILTSAVNSSQLVKVGRSILLYDLPDIQQSLPASQQGLYSALNNFFVVGQPWESN
jgi:MFS family permease